MATRSKRAAGQAKDEHDGVRTLRLRIKGKHAPYLRELARESNLVWNYLNERQEGLEVRGWVCSECGTVHHRDVNAAKNILAAGHGCLAGGIPALTA